MSAPTPQQVSEEAHRYHSLLNALQTGVVFYNQEGQIETANRAALQILEYPQDHVVGKTSFDPQWNTIKEDGSPFLPEEHPAEITRTTGQPKSNVLLGLVLNSDRTKWLRISTQPVIRQEDGQQLGVAVTFEDVTESRNSSLESARRDGLSQVINKLGESLLSNGDWHQSLEEVTPLLGESIDAKWLFIFKRADDSSSGKMIELICQWQPGQPVEKTSHDTSAHINLEELGLSKWLDSFQKNQIVITTQFSSAENAFFSEHAVSRCLLVPIQANGVWWGFMGMADGTHLAEWKQEIDLFESVVRLIGTGIERSQNQEKFEATLLSLEEKNAQLQKLNQLMVGRELKMVSLKSKLAEAEQAPPPNSHDA